MKDFKRVKLKGLYEAGDPCLVCNGRDKKYKRLCEECREHDCFTFDGYIKKLPGEEGVDK